MNYSECIEAFEKLYGPEWLAGKCVLLSEMRRRIRGVLHDARQSNADNRRAVNRLKERHA